MGSSWKRNSLIYIVILLAAILLFSYLLQGNKKTEEIPLSQVVTMSQNKEITEIQVEQDTLTGYYR